MTGTLETSELQLDAGTQTSGYNTTLSREDESEEGSTLQDKPRIATTEQERVEYPPLGSELYGKWQWLSMDPKRLLFESDINGPKTGTVRLVDLPENESDIVLWSLLLQFCHRRMGRDGMIMIWPEVFRRRKLREVDGPLAQAFWRAILDAAVSNEIFLTDVWLYAEFLLEAHGARWPRLYSTTMSFLLSNRSAKDVARWHIRLSPSFGLGENDFMNLLMKIVTNPEEKLQRKLQMLYHANLYRRAYDVIIPHLFSKGLSNRARSWRKIFRLLNDEPRTSAARPFLRYLAAYYPQIPLTRQETLEAGLDDEAFKLTVQSRNMQYLIDRNPGETHGIKEKTYNDSLGARWFASSWVQLDFAINVVHTMGVERIGPLSVQSIALREDTAAGVLHRLDQLHQLKINVPTTNYVRIIRHLASIGDNETLQDLLHSDIHPDVFDDYSAQGKLLGECFRTGNWKLYRLVFAARLAVSSDMITQACNQLLHSCAHQGNMPMTLNVLRDMAATDVRILPKTSHLLSSIVLHHVSPHHTVGGSNVDINIYVNVCRHLAASRFPPAVEVWQLLLSRLGRDKRLDDLERLSLDIMRMYMTASSAQSMIVFHESDVPGILRKETAFPYFQKVPSDLPLSHVQHPIRQVFDVRLQSSIVRWGFTYSWYERRPGAYTLMHHDSARGTLQKEPHYFYFARGVRLLAMLREQGLVVHDDAVRKAVLLRLIDLYRKDQLAQPPTRPSKAPTKSKHLTTATAKQLFEAERRQVRLEMLRKANHLTLAEAMQLCEAAWGSAFLPPVADLQKIIAASGGDVAIMLDDY